MIDAHETFLAATRAHKAGNLAEAARLYRAVLDIHPHHADALHLLGLIASQNANHDQSIDYIRRAVALNPRSAPFLNNLGEAYRRAGRIGEAIESYRRALELVPSFPHAHYNLGIALRSQGHYNEALSHYQQAVTLEPRYVQAWYNMANLLREEGRVDLAIEAYRRALALKPDHAEAHLNLGSALKERGDVPGSIDSFNTALRYDPGNTDIRGNLVQSYLAAGERSQAMAELDALAKLHPEKWWYRFRRDTLVDDIAESNAAIDDSRDRVSAALDRYSSRTLMLDAAELHSSCIEPPMALTYQGRDERPLRERYAQLFAPLLPESNPSRKAGKPHVGFVVTHGHEGVFLKCMRGILNHISGDRFHISVCCSQAGRNIISRAIGNGAVEFVVLPRGVQEAAAAIGASGIDLLHYWEVGTDSTNYFMPYLRPAPVQCATWGWPVTTGIPQMDYFVSSALIEPEGAEAHYSEKLVRLPSLPTYYYRPPLPQQLHARSHFGLAEGRNVYLCIQNVRKFHPDFDSVIGDILRRDPNGELVILAVKEKHLVERLLARFRVAIPDVANRIRTIPQMPEPEYLNLIAVADVVLDTLHYGGGANTTYDSLYTGTPIVTLPGAFHRGRFCAGAYRRIGIEECVADSPDAYVGKAVDIASDPDYRHDLRERILAAAPMLYEDINPARELEDFFEQAITDARAG
jgi:predicted O-linked N-acetylglucosamine transferase (SPINDLY family)